MEKFVFENQTYYINKGLVYDDSFLEVPVIESSKVLGEYFKGIDYKTLDMDGLIDYVKQLKLAKKYANCISVIEYGLLKFAISQDYYITVFPIITSCYRAMGQSQKAIEFWMSNKRIFASCLSVPLLTSLAAAYCDVGNYELAKRCANRAYAMQGGSKNYQTELSLVYGRIKKETRDKE